MTDNKKISQLIEERSKFPTKSKEYNRLTHRIWYERNKFEIPFRRMKHENK